MPDFRCGFEGVFFVAFSFAGFLLEIASSISFWPAARLFHDQPVMGSLPPRFPGNVFA
jgi:hypothetical protein